MASRSVFLDLVSEGIRTHWKEYVIFPYSGLRTLDFAVAVINHFSFTEGQLLPCQEPPHSLQPEVHVC